MITSSIKVALILGAAAVPLLAFSCGNSGEAGDDVIASGGGSSIDLGNSGSGTGPLINPGTSPECSPSPDDSGCVGVNFEGESVPLDIYVMFDLSCSMSCTVDQTGCCLDPDLESEWRIQPVRQAMRTFLRDPLSAGIGVGLGFFGDHDVNQPNDPAVCTVESHADATVPIKTLPAAADALISELDDGKPQGGTPTHLAIDGACVYASNWREANRSHKVVILLVTDGIPEHSCNANIGLATEAAEGCYDTGRGLETYVLGIVANNNNTPGNANSLDNLDSIAEAGGTEHAYLTNTEDISGSVLAALNAIRADAVIPCDLKIPTPPAGETIDPSKINLGICDGAGDVVVTPYVESESACNGTPGWFYDDPASPETIHLCDVTCETVSAPGSSLFFSVGCDTRMDVF